MNVVPQAPGLPAGYDQNSGTVAPGSAQAPSQPPSQAEPTAPGAVPQGALMVSNGQAAYVPLSQVTAAQTAGAEFGVRMTDPKTGDKAIVPFSQQDQAQQNGATWDVHRDNDLTKALISSGDGTPDGVIMKVGTGFAGELYSAAKGIVAQIEPPALHGDFSQGAASFLPPAYTKAVQGTEQLPDNYRVYESARSQGQSPSQAFAAASGVDATKKAVVANVEARIKEFKTDPSTATGKALADLAPILLSLGGAAPEEVAAGGLADTAEAAEVPEAAEEAATTPSTQVADASTATPATTPSAVSALSGATDTATPAETANAATKATPAGTTMMQKTANGLFQSPEEAQEAASGPKVIQAMRDFAGDTSQGPIRKALDSPINQGYADFKAQYKVIDDAADTDFKNLYDKLDDANEKARLAAPGSMEEAQAEKARASVTDAIEDAKAQAQERGVSNIDGLLDKADARFQQVQALKDVRAKLYSNPSIIKGNAAHGVDEFGRVNHAIDTVERLDSPNKFGNSRIAQTPGGPDSVFKLKQALYDAQTAGQRAAARQQSFQMGKNSVPVVHQLLDAGRAVKNVFRP
jgi:hypothetical protein